MGPPVIDDMFFFIKGGQLGPPFSDVTVFNQGGQLGPLISDISFFNEGGQLGLRALRELNQNKYPIQAQLSDGGAKKDIGKPPNVHARNISWQMYPSRLKRAKHSVL